MIMLTFNMIMLTFNMLMLTSFALLIYVMLFWRCHINVKICI